MPVSIFHIGLPLDHPLIPEEERPKIAKRLSDLQARMTHAGYKYQVIHASPETGLDGFRHLLIAQRCDGVLIGGGVAGDPSLSYFMEQIIDVTHEAAPKAKIMFYSHSVDVLTVVERWFRMPLLIRDEQTLDREQVRGVNEAAFGRSDEADLVDNLRAQGATLLSLVAEVDGHIVGHILFSRMTVETEQGPVAAVSLAPMAVLPEHQGRQIGSQLVRRGLNDLRDHGERIVLVLGHKEYYPRFGFSAEKACHLSSPFPPEAYMALELAEGALAGVQGCVRYASAFGL